MGDFREGYDLCVDFMPDWVLSYFLVETWI